MASTPSKFEIERMKKIRANRQAKADFEQKYLTPFEDGVHCWNCMLEGKKVAVCNYDSHSCCDYYPYGASGYLCNAHCEQFCKSKGAVVVNGKIKSFQDSCDIIADERNTFCDNMDE